MKSFCCCLGNQEEENLDGNQPQKGRLDQERNYLRNENESQRDSSQKQNDQFGDEERNTNKNQNYKSDSVVLSNRKLSEKGIRSNHSLDKEQEIKPTSANNQKTISKQSSNSRTSRRKSQILKKSSEKNIDVDHYRNMKQPNSRISEQSPELNNDSMRSNTQLINSNREVIKNDRDDEEEEKQVVRSIKSSKKHNQNYTQSSQSQITSYAVSSSFSSIKYIHPNDINRKYQEYQHVINDLKQKKIELEKRLNDDITEEEKQNIRDKIHYEVELRILVYEYRIGQLDGRKKKKLVQSEQN